MMLTPTIRKANAAWIVRVCATIGEDIYTNQGDDMVDYAAHALADIRRKGHQFTRNRFVGFMTQRWRLREHTDDDAPWEGVTFL